MLGYFCSFHPSTEWDLAYLMVYSITKEELKWANSQEDMVDLLPQERFWFCLSCWLSSLKLFVCNPLTSWSLVPPVYKDWRIFHVWIWQ